jgi:hypothetical protein
LKQIFLLILLLGLVALALREEDIQPQANNYSNASPRELSLQSSESPVASQLPTLLSLKDNTKVTGVLELESLSLDLLNSHTRLRVPVIGSDATTILNITKKHLSADGRISVYSGNTNFSGTVLPISIAISDAAVMATLPSLQGVVDVTVGPLGLNVITPPKAMGTDIHHESVDSLMPSLPAFPEGKCINC